MSQPSSIFECGQRVPASGIYRVYHDQHRLPHEVTVFRGETFPRCSACDEHVRFEVVRLVEELDDLREKMVLCQLPVLPERTHERRRRTDPPKAA